eukprot:13305250-Ditylum_brightwellii.AAC.1
MSPSSSLATSIKDIIEDFDDDDDINKNDVSSSSLSKKKATWQNSIGKPKNCVSSAKHGTKGEMGHSSSNT